MISWYRQNAFNNILCNNDIASYKIRYKWQNKTREVITIKWQNKTREVITICPPPPPNVFILKFSSLSNVNHNQNIISIQIFHPIIVDPKKSEKLTHYNNM